MIENFISAEPWPSQALILPRLQAHRGYWLGGAQENTIEAFREARARGALMFECDVRLSKDQVPVLFHDENLQRLKARPEAVRDLTAEELKEYAQAPTLREALSDSKVPRFVNIELKSKQKLDDPLERKVAEVVKSQRAENRVLFSSFNPFSLYRMSLHLSLVPRALLVSQADDPDNHPILKHMWLAPFLKFHCLHLDKNMVNETNMRMWQKRGIPVAIWTVNGKEEIQKFLRMGAISVITDTL